MAINLPIISKFDNKGVSQATSAFDGIGKKLLGIGALVAGAFSVKAIVDFGKEATLAAQAIETSGARIDQIAKSMDIFGDETDAVTKRLKEYANANEQLFATDENVIMSTQAKLLTFKELAGSAGDVGGAFDRATAAAIDLAAAGFGSAESNAVQLGKALNDPIKGITALNRSGVTFTEVEREKIKALTESGQMLEAQDMILAAIEKQVGGTAAATADASVQMALAFGEIKESVGAALLPAFQTVTGALIPLIQDLLPKLKAFLDDNIAPALQRVADGFAALVGRIREGESIGKVIGSMFAGIGDFFTGGGFEAAFERMATIREKIIVAILEAIPGIIEGLIAMLPKIISFIVDTLLPTMVSNFLLIFNSLADIFQQVMPQLIDALVELVPMVVRAIADLLPVIIRTLLGMLPTLLSTAIVLFNSLVDAVVEILPMLIETIGDLLPEILKSVLEMLPAILDGAIKLFTALVAALPIILPPLITAIIDLLPKIITALVSMLPLLIDGAVSLFIGIVEALPLIIPDLIKATTGLTPIIVKALIDAIPQLVRAGIDLLGGLAKGLLDNAPRIIGSAIASVGSTLVNGFKSVLKISSPSKVFANLGGDVIDGLSKGLGDGKGLIAGAAVDMAHTLEVSGQNALGNVTPLNFASPSKAGSSSSTANTFNITVNAGMGADGNRIGEQIVNEILRFERSSGRVFARA